MTVAGLPELDQPSVIPLAAVVGALLGALFGRIRQNPPDDVRRLAEGGVFYGVAVGFLLYAVALIAGI